jgi:hypothetical protein
LTKAKKEANPTPHRYKILRTDGGDLSKAASAIAYKDGARENSVKIRA